jgi:hypothetical protein
MRCTTTSCLQTLDENEGSIVLRCASISSKQTEDGRLNSSAVACKSLHAVVAHTPPAPARQTAQHAYPGAPWHSLVPLPAAGRPAQYSSSRSAMHCTNSSVRLKCKYMCSLLAAVRVCLLQYACCSTDMLAAVPLLQYPCHSTQAGSARPVTGRRMAQVASTTCLPAHTLLADDKAPLLHTTSHILRPQHTWFQSLSGPTLSLINS